MKKLRILVLLLVISGGRYAYSIEYPYAEELPSGDFMHVAMDNLGTEYYRYELFSWRLGFNSSITYRDYTTLSASAFNNAGTEIQSELGYSFTPEQLPWDQGPYANRLFFSENDYGVNNWDALSLAYIVQTDGSFIYCQDHTVGADSQGDILVSAAVYGADNELCNIDLGKRVNAGMLVFNEYEYPFSVTEQTHLILHEFAHLFGLIHLEYLQDPKPYQCDSLMIRKKEDCSMPASTIGSADAAALNYLKTDNSIGP